MPILDTQRQRAAWLILALGLALLWALWPFSTGLIGAPVLYVVFAPVQRELVRVMRPGIAAGIVVLLAIVLVVAPLVSVIGLVANEAQEMGSGVIRSPLLARIREIRVGPYQVGAQLEALGSALVSWLGSSALGFIGTATRMAIQLTIAFFGLFYLLVAPHQAWRGLRPFIPFSTASAEVLRDRFQDVTISTLVGTGLTAAVQGTLVGLGFWVTGLSNPHFWGVVTVIFAILPVVGSGLVWIPGAAALAIDGRYGAAIGLALLGLVVVGNIDNVIRPYVYRRWAQIHPFITVIGAFAGIRFFGLLGLLIGPLAISYFFELIRMYRVEYLDEEDPDIAERLAQMRRSGQGDRRAARTEAGKP
ncbi:MAG TPA: AI-2E family transporter [Gemmatimonadales bacterium]|nr:AI-2E family transporter [Gemmatimonadales bacterium]